MMDISAFEEELEKLRSGFVFDTTKLCGMYVAALARAEAAKVERNIAARRAFNAEAENQRLAADNRRLSAELAAPRLRAGERDERGETMKPDDAAIMHTAPLVDFDLEWITGPARALLARVEAAEALAYERLEAALFAEQERDDANLEVALEQANAREAWIRVAELEAQLAGHGWRPVTEEPDDMYWYLTLNTNPDEIDDPGYRISFWDGTWEHECTHYRPLPPVPQEPTQ